MIQAALLESKVLDLSMFSKIFSGGNEGEIRRMRPIVDSIVQKDSDMQAMTDAALRQMSDELRTRAQNGEPTEKLLVDSFALVREAAWRSLGMRHYPVQLMGGMVLHNGRIAEMKTGEGKTLVCTLPAYLNALPGKGVHVVTVNDYLARRDAEWMGKVHRFLGLNVGVVVHDLKNAAKHAAYGADITYGTNSEFGFDYLRDNMVTDIAERFQRGLNYAIVDEVDSILVDEARTPLIISGAGEKSTELYSKADRFVAKLRMDEDFERDEKKKTINLLPQGVQKAENFFNLENLADPENNEIFHHINQGLRARFLMFRDRDYVVQNGQVLIVDEFTGRIMTGRRYSEGLHQAIEAKENVKVERENMTMATITYQNYFRMYKKLCGMTGTAKTEEEEFKAIYSMDVVCVPTHMPMVRKDQNDVIYRSEEGKFNAVVEEIVERHATGQPILCGTVSVERSEYLSGLLKQRGVPHHVLNAKHHEKEAMIIAQAGKFGSVTIATNMAGRGTDILLGGNPDFLARQELHKAGLDDALIETATGHQETTDEAILSARQAYSDAFKKHKALTDKEHDEVIAVGGLHIIGTERHESRRIDNQLRGRAGRQGDIGSSRFYLSLQDDLIRLFAGERIASYVAGLNLDENTPMEFGILTRQIETAQKRVESRNFEIRKNVLEYDDIMNQMRELIYSQRQQVLSGADVHENIMEMLQKVCNDTSALYANENNSDLWDIEGLCKEMDRICHTTDAFDTQKIINNCSNAKQVADFIYDEVKGIYDSREAEITQNGIDMREVERVVLLRAVDSHWMDHIDAMDQLRQGIGLRAFGQRNPIIEYKIEGFDMFDAMVASIREETVKMLLGIRVDKQPERMEAPKITGMFSADDVGPAGPIPTGQAATSGSSTPAKADVRVGRNDPCPCGSGKKYKYCCGQGEV